VIMSLGGGRSGLLTTVMRRQGVSMTQPIFRGLTSSTGQPGVAQFCDTATVHAVLLHRVTDLS
jgi:hypothetical protein